MLSKEKLSLEQGKLVISFLKNSSYPWYFILGNCYKVIDTCKDNIDKCLEIFEFINKMESHNLKGGFAAILNYYHLEIIPKDNNTIALVDCKKMNETTFSIIPIISNEKEFVDLFQCDKPEDKFIFFDKQNLLDYEKEIKKLLKVVFGYIEKDLYQIIDKNK